MITLATTNRKDWEKNPKNDSFHPMTHHLRHHHHHHGKATVADIGCDHGLLTYGLAASSWFQKVIGVDVSQPALQMGGWNLIQTLGTDQIGTTPMEFKLWTLFVLLVWEFKP
jgi:2-polyprenyl-3-methyl-5-hydroxy-6-metoxy-1,4-benzoquinol methylase